jgi:hypothetical protein
MWYFMIVSQNMPMTASVVTVGTYSMVSMYSNTAYSRDTSSNQDTAAAAAGSIASHLRHVLHGVDVHQHSLWQVTSSNRDAAAENGSSSSSSSRTTMLSLILSSRTPSPLLNMEML